MEALRGCPPSARDRRAPPWQPNVNLGATRARTRPATRRAPLRPVWRHGRRWRGERRPSWCYSFAAERRATCRSHVLNLLAYREGSARRGASPVSAEGSLRRNRWASLRLPSCTSALARTAADSFPEASRRGTRRQENSETRHRSYHTTRTTKRGRAALPPNSRISAARKPSPRSLVSTRGSPSRGRRRCPSSKMRRGASRRSRAARPSKRRAP